MPYWEHPNAAPKNWYKWVSSLYWLLDVPLAGMFTEIKIQHDGFWDKRESKRTLKWRRASAVKEVNADTGRTTPVGGVERASEVRQQVDGSAIVGTVGENTRDSNTSVGLGVVTDDDGVDEECQQRVLVGSGVVLQQGS